MATRGPKLQISPFDVTEDRLDCGRLWSRWVERFERELIYHGVEVSTKPDLARAALLIHAGIAVEDIHDSLPDMVKPENIVAASWTSYAGSKAKLAAYFSPQVCNDFAIFELINTKMQSSKTIAAYALRLREAAKKCDFSNWNEDKMIKMLLISNMQDEELRLKLLQKDRPLTEVLRKAQQKEDAQARNKVLSKEKSGSRVNKMRGTCPNKKRTETGGENEIEKGDMVHDCKKCGYQKHEKDRCPARDRRCIICKELGHFAKTCKDKKAKEKSSTKKVEGSSETDTDSDDGGRCHKVAVMRVNSRVTLMKVVMNGNETIWQPDTGTEKNLMDATHMKEYEVKHNCEVKLMRTKAKLFAYGSDEELTVLGKFRAKFCAGGKEVEDMVYVTQEESEYPLISESTAIGLGLVEYNEEFIVKKINGKEDKRDIGTRIKKKFPELFTGKIGKYKGKQIKLMIKEDAVPLAQAPRRIPIHLMEKAEAKVEQLLKEDVVERFPDEEPRSYINPNVISPKPNGDIRFCLDMRYANNSIQRPYTTIPTLDEIKAKFAGAQRFSKIDLKEAYNQFELDPESRNITAFYGPDGLYRFKRLNYGTKSSQDIMQLELQRILAGIANQFNMADDILVGGTIEEHDEALEEVCTKLKEAGITLNPEKCIFDVCEVSFMGLVFSEEGIRPDPKHIKNLKEAKAPRSQAELRSFLGMAGYSMRFIKDFANIVHPMRVLQKNKKWEWNKECQESFEKLTGCLSEHTMLHHFVPGKETEIIVDASGTGLGACLVQRKGKDKPFHVVSYRSRALKDVETRYSATEREALAIRWAVKKLRNLLLGGPKFKVVTDHKPLQYMFNKMRGEIPPRIERFIMDLQEYDYEVGHIPGTSMIADFYHETTLADQEVHQ